MSLCLSLAVGLFMMQPAVANPMPVHGRPPNGRPGLVKPIQLMKGVRTGWLYARVLVNGKQATLAVDTGCYECVLTPAGASRLGFPCRPSGGGWQRVFGNKVEVFQAVTAPTDIGNGRPVPVMFAVHEVNNGFDRAHATRDQVPVCDGLIGYPMLAHLMANIDYSAATMRVTDSTWRESGLTGVWQGEKVKLAEDDDAIPARNHRLTLTPDSFAWEYPDGRLDGSWLLDLGGSPRLMNWQVRDERKGGYTIAQAYQLDGDRLTVAGSLLPGGERKEFRPTALTPAGTKYHDVVTFRRVARERAPAPRPLP